MLKPYQEEHDLFREQVRKFAENELAPNVDEWERDECFPNWVFKKAGELGILGAHYPEELGGGQVGVTRVQGRGVDQPFLDQQFWADEQGVAGEGGWARIGGVAVAHGYEG